MKRTQFKVMNHLIYETSDELYLNQVDEIKHHVAKVCRVEYEDVEVVIVENEYSNDIDITANGEMVFWKALYHNPIVGVSCLIDENSDEFLDAINKGDVEKYLTFFI